MAYSEKKSLLFRHDAKSSDKLPNGENSGISMKGLRNKGRNYAPLFLYLLNKGIGRDTDSLISELKSRLDTIKVVFWMVKTPEEIANAEHVHASCVRIGENSFWSTLTYNKDKVLFLVEKDFNIVLQDLVSELKNKGKATT